MTRKIALYLRVSTTRDQTTENQLRSMTAWADSQGHQIIQVYEDEGLSGTLGPDKRPALARMLEDAEIGYFEGVAVVALDRLGRDPLQLIKTVNRLASTGVALFVAGKEVDLGNSEEQLSFHMQAAVAQYERNKIRDRTLAGLERARRRGVRLGRPPLSEYVTRQIETHLRAGTRISNIARLVGVSRPTVYKIRNATRCSQ